MKTALVWFRRDLRVHDNPALLAASRSADRVVPVFIWDPEADAPWQPGGASRWWLHHSLASLSKTLARLGAPLVIRRGDSAGELERLIAATGADAVYWNRLYEPAIREREKKIKAELGARGIDAQSSNSALLHEPWEVKTQGGDPYRVFTPFWKAARARIFEREPVPAPTRLAPVEGLVSEPLESLGLLPKIPWDAGLAKAWVPGESGAFAMLERFAEEAIVDYADRRDRPAVMGTSRLSPHLHFGEISPRQAAARVARVRAAESDQGTETYLKELGWREFGHHLLYHYPHTTDAPMDERFAKMAWRTDPAALERWKRGQTGFPIVDAGLRELWTAGWMHNRVRMIVASMLTKNLLIDWREGARWFWDTLVDADLASNTLGWQWTAGCGADAAPFFRIFNPVLQSKKFDPQGVYLRRWLPELKGVADADIHEPREGAVVDLMASRDRALEAFAAIKK